MRVCLHILESLELRLHRGFGRDCVSVNELNSINFESITSLWSAYQTNRPGVEAQRRPNIQIA